MENAVNRESYSLAAGLALGLVMLEVTVVSMCNHMVTSEIRDFDYGLYLLKTPKIRSFFNIERENSSFFSAYLFIYLFIFMYFFFLKYGNEAASVADLKIADQLYHYMVGGQTKPQVGF